MRTRNRGSERTPVSIPTTAQAFHNCCRTARPVAAPARSRRSIATARPVYAGITIHHPNGDFAGRFQKICPADDFQSGEDFEITLEPRGFHLDPSLGGMKDKLPGSPFHFVIESIWFHTLEEQAGLEIAELELMPPG